MPLGRTQSLLELEKLFFLENSLDINGAFAFTQSGSPSQKMAWVTGRVGFLTQSRKFLADMT